MKLRSGRPVSLVPVELAAADEGWDDLAAAAGNPFATAEWVGAWWRHLGSGRTLTIWRVLDDDGRLVALLPLVRLERGPLALVRFAGHGAADQLGPVCAPGDATLAAAGLREIAGRLRGAGLLLADRVPVEDGYAASLAGSVLRHHASPAGVETIVLGGRAATSVSLGAYRALQRFPQAPRRAIATRAD